MVTQNADVDTYRVAGKAGEHLSVEVASVWLTEKFYADAEFDLMVRLLDGTGRELARNDDSALHLQDPIISTVLPKDGDYYVEVRQRIFKRGTNVYYLASIGTNRRPLAAYPARRPGGPTPVGEAASAIRPANTSRPLCCQRKPATLIYYDEAPSPLPLRVSNYPNVLEDRDAEATHCPATSRPL